MTSVIFLSFPIMKGVTYEKYRNMCFIKRIKELKEKYMDMVECFGGETYGLFQYISIKNFAKFMVANNLFPKKERI